MSVSPLVRLPGRNPSSIVPPALAGLHSFYYFWVWTAGRLCHQPFSLHHQPAAVYPIVEGGVKMHNIPLLYIYVFNHSFFSNASIHSGTFTCECSANALKNTEAEQKWYSLQATAPFLEHVKEYVINCCSLPRFGMIVFISAVKRWISHVPHPRPPFFKQIWVQFTGDSVHITQTNQCAHQKC